MSQLVGDSPNTRSDSGKEQEGSESTGVGMQVVGNIKVDVTVLLGKCNISMEKLMKLSMGDILSLDQQVNEPLRIYVGEELIAMGEIIVLNDRIGIKLTELTKT